MENNKNTSEIQNKTTSIVPLSRWLISLSILLLSIFLQTLASFFPEKIETYYSRSIYPYIGQVFSLFNKLVWFSIAELLLLLLFISIITWAVYQANLLYKKHLTKKEFFIKNLWRFTIAINLGLLFFLLLWGLNYQKQPLKENLKLKSRQVDSKELIKVCEYFIDKTNQSYKEILKPTFYLTGNDNNDNKSESKLPLSWDELNKTIESSFQKEILLKDLAFGSYGPAKAVYFSGSMSRFGISGIFIPLTGEPNVNVAQTEAAIPFTLAHEKAHQRGFALEDEANFLAFLICADSDDAYSRYSGYLMATTYLLNSVSNVAPEDYKELYQKLSIGPKNDLRAMYKFWAEYQGKLSQASEAINNSYLRANRVRLGIKNYNQVVDLIISYYFTYLYRSDTNKQNITTGNNS